MQREQTNIEDNVLVSDPPSASSSETELAQKLANTRIVSKEEVCQVEQIDIKETLGINSVFLSSESASVANQSELFSKIFHSKAPQKTHPKRFHTIESTGLDVDDIQICELTDEHLQQYPTDAHTDDAIYPIEPITHHHNSEPQTIRFVGAKQYYDVKIQLRDSNGNRQCVYKRCDTKDDAQEVRERIGSEVELTAKEGTIQVLTRKASSTERDVKSVVEKVGNGIWWSGIAVLVGGIVWGVPTWIVHTLLQLFEAPTSSTIVFSFGFMLMGVAVMLYLLEIFDESVEEPDNSTQESSDPVAVTLDQHSETTICHEKTPTAVTVQARYEDSKLVLVCEEIPDSLQWEFEVSDEGVFRDTRIADFYTELGFDAIEQTSFVSYISSKEYEGVLSLATTGKNQLYLYPEYPQSVDD